MKKKKIEKLFQADLDNTFKMNDRFEEALTRAGVEKKDKRFFYFNKKSFIIASTLACMAMVGISTITTYLIEEKDKVICVDFGGFGSSNYRCLSSAHNYFMDYGIDLEDCKIVFSYQIDEKLIFNVYSNYDNYYFQIYDLVLQSNNTQIELKFDNLEKEKMYYFNIVNANHMDKINDEKFLLTGDYFTCDVSIDKNFNKKYYINL